MSVKERAALARRQKFMMEGEPFYIECLTCNMDCDRLIKGRKTKISFKDCPKIHTKRDSNGKKD